MAAAVGAGGAMLEVPPNRIPPGCAAITPEMLLMLTIRPYLAPIIVRRTAREKL